MIGSNLHIPTCRFSSNIRGKEAKRGRYLALTGLRILISSLLLILLIVAEGWSRGAGSVRARRMELSPTQKRLNEIRRDRDYSKIIEEYEKAIPQGKTGDAAGLIQFYGAYKRSSEPKLVPRTGGESGQISPLRKKYREISEHREISEQARIQVRDREAFAKTLFRYNPDDHGALSNALIIDYVQVTWRKVYIEVRHKSSQAEKRFSYGTTDEMRAVFPQDVKKWLGTNEATMVLSTVNLPRRCTGNELARPLGLPFVRIISTAPRDMEKIGPRQEVCRERLSQMDGQNTIFLDGLPVDEVGLKNLGKDVKNLGRWQAADGFIRDLIAREKSVVLKADAQTFKDTLLRGGPKDIVAMIGNVDHGAIVCASGSRITARDIDEWPDRASARDVDGWEGRKAEGGDPPVLFLIGCDTANTARGGAGEIIERLLKKGYISGAWGTKDFTSPDEAGKMIHVMLRTRKEGKSDPASDLPQLEGPIVKRVLQDRGTIEGAQDGILG